MIVIFGKSLSLIVFFIRVKELVIRVWEVIMVVMVVMVILNK